MNRENKRKTFEKGYYKTHACSDTFVCKVCGYTHEGPCDSCPVCGAKAAAFFKVDDACCLNK